jgi:hypothetical protein
MKKKLIQINKRDQKTGLNMRENERESFEIEITSL